MDFNKLYRGREVAIKLNHLEGIIAGKIENVNDLGVTVIYEIEDVTSIIMAPWSSVALIEYQDEINNES